MKRKDAKKEPSQPLLVWASPENEAETDDLVLR